MEIGDQINMLTLLEKTHDRDRDYHVIGKFKCICENIVYKPITRVKQEKIKSCGCAKTTRLTKPKENLTGQKFNRLTVVKLHHERNTDGKFLWECKCDCGGITHVVGWNLKNNKTRSCGCIQREVVVKRNKENTTHSMSNSRIYNIWDTMRARCERKSHKSYESYGGRGIKVCVEWHNFEKFFKWAFENGYEEYLTLDRIDFNGNYDPSNCRWITQQEQHYNTRKNRYIEYNGEKKTVSQWAEIIGISRQGLRYRLEAGWSIEDLFSERDQGKIRIEQERNHITHTIK